jgi:hypothetical protein
MDLLERDQHVEGTKKENEDANTCETEKLFSVMGKI